MADGPRRVAGTEYLALVTRLLQRARLASATGGLWEAADLQWWWRRDRHPDPARQTFWFTGGDPVAAVVVTDWARCWGLEVLSASHDVAAVLPQAWPVALAVLDRDATRPVEMAVRDDDHAVTAAAAAAGFVDAGERYTTTWMEAERRPAVPPLPGGFTLVDRATAPEPQHHLARRSGPDVAERLAECSLYRPALDLAVRTTDGEVAAYAVFWADPVTGVGLVEPVRTEDAYQGRGLARHVLAAGLDRLARAGCRRLKVTYLEGNEPARRLYLGAGFVPVTPSRTYRRS